MGQGGSGAAFLAIDETSGKKVTLKRAKAEGPGAVYRIKSLETEAKILGELRHKAIPKLFFRSREMIALGYIPGESLEKVIMSKGTFSEKEAVKIALELAGILRYLHGRRQAVIYRDLKPANIVLKPDGHVGLIDFGAARLYDPLCQSDTTHLGTLGFAAPEQFGNLGQTDPRTDIYCFGMTLLQMLSGVDPKDTDAAYRYKKNGINGVSKELMAIIDKCTRPDKEDRFRSMKEVEEALLGYPEKVRKRKLFGGIRISLAAAVIAVVVAMSTMYADKVKAYAASDIEVRMPAVKQRIYSVKLRLIDIAEGRFGEVGERDK